MIMYRSLLTTFKGQVSLAIRVGYVPDKFQIVNTKTDIWAKISLKRADFPRYSRF